jgi:hypothetical protein
MGVAHGSLLALDVGVAGRSGRCPRRGLIGAPRLDTQLAGNWPETRRKQAGNSPETGRELAGSWPGADDLGERLHEVAGNRSKSPGMKMKDATGSFAGGLNGLALLSLIAAFVCAFSCTFQARFTLRRPRSQRVSDRERPCRTAISRAPRAVAHLAVAALQRVPELYARRPGSRLRRDTRGRMRASRVANCRSGMRRGSALGAAIAELGTAGKRGCIA